MPTNPDPDLMRIFDFTPADLEANRAGRLSERQKNILRNNNQNQRRLIKKSIIGFPLIGLLFSLFNFRPDDVQLWLSSTAMLVIELFFTAALFSIFIYRTNSYRERLLNINRVESVKGIQLWIQMWYRRMPFAFSNAYWIKSSNLCFAISKERFNQLEMYLNGKDENVSYHLYHPSNSRWLLSLEVINDHEYSNDSSVQSIGKLPND